MAVNMEVENTTKEIDTRLSTSDSTEFSDDIRKDSENYRNHEDSLSSLKNLAIDETVYEERSENETQAAQGIQRNVLVDHTSKNEECDETPDCSSNQQENNSLVENDNDSEKAARNITDGHIPQAPLAFTIDFGDTKEVDTAKYQNLFERYNARHKRNLSASKVDINPKKQASALSSNLTQKQKVSSTHSEGYFSSEDDPRRKPDQLSEKLRQLGSKSIFKSQQTAKLTSDTLNKQSIMTKSYEEQPKQCKLSRKNLSLELGHSKTTKPYWEPQKSATINDLSRVQTSNYDDDTEKLYTKNIDPIDAENEWQDEKESKYCETVSEKVSNLNYIRNKNLDLREHNLSSVSYTVEIGEDDMAEANIEVFNVSNIDAGSDGAASEAGTYTIYKDYTDEEKARMDIDKVFSVGVLREDECNEAYVHSFKMSVSRDNTSWISEWATQVAEHNSLPPVIGGVTGRTPPLSPSKIPSPIHSRSQRLVRNRNDQSDSNLDTEPYLKIKERLALVSNQHTLIDSGGESDDDTSNSYNTPPHSSQRTPVHSALTRRGSLSESLFKRVNTSETRKSLRKYLSSSKSKTDDISGQTLSSPSQDFASLHLGRRSSSLDRREYTSDTPESNTSRRSSMKYYQGDESPYTNSPILNRVRPSTPKLTNSPIVTRKTIGKIINSPVLEKTKHLTKSSPQAKNIGYFTCIENSPYMLRKSNSTTSYHEGSIGFNGRDLTGKATSVLRNSPNLPRNLNIQRSCSNANIKSTKSQNVLSRRSSFNSSDIDRSPSERRCLVASDSSSETGEQQTKPSSTSISTGIKLNRAFSIRRARLNCESDTTPNTTPEEKRRRAQTEAKSTLSNKQQNHRSRASSVAVYSKETVKKPEPAKPRTPSISRADITRSSGRAVKPAQQTPTAQRSNQKVTKENKKSTRSNSTLTSKEVEFQNWKRRKSYDPMKAAAEGRKKLVDSTKKHHSTDENAGSHDNSVLRSASFHGTGGALSLANDWSDNEFNYENNQVPPPCSPQLESDSDLETSYHLQATQNVVSAMSARITMRGSPLVDSDNESDDDTSHSLCKNTSNAIHQPSDTESSDERPTVPEPVTTSTKYNRTLSLRKARIDAQPIKPIISSANKAKSTTRTVRIKPESTTISRTDSGRFSMRLNKSSNPQGPKTKPKETKKPATPNAKEVEMQNWKRRKSYDPMKAAMEGRKKAGLAKKNANANLSPSHVARSQSFHGSVGLAGNWSDDELVASADEAEIYY